MKLDDNPQMVAMLDNAKGSLENKIRQAYNSGYNDGFKAGVFEAWNDIREQLNKSLRQQIEQIEPQTDIGTSDTVYSDTAGYVPRADMTDCAWMEVK